LDVFDILQYTYDWFLLGSTNNVLSNCFLSSITLAEVKKRLYKISQTQQERDQKQNQLIKQ
jgi:hypothetical protein